MRYRLISAIQAKDGPLAFRVAVSISAAVPHAAKAADRSTHHYTYTHIHINVTLAWEKLHVVCQVEESRSLLTARRAVVHLSGGAGSERSMQGRITRVLG